jgi:branched-chain amino acid transport system substrate-binding protein
MSRIKIGVLAPSSNYFPRFSKNLISVLNYGLEACSGLDYELCIEPAGFNAREQEVNTKLQELLISHQVDLVIAPLNTGLLCNIKKTLSDEQVPLIAITLGEDVVFQDAQGPLIFVNSYNLWQSTWLSGYRCAEKYGPKISSITAFHDAGYGMAFALGLGLEAKEGALILAQVTHRDGPDQDPSEAIQELINTNPDAVMAFYSGRETLSFLQVMKETGANGRFPMLTLPFTVDHALQAESGDLAVGLTSISSWNFNAPEAKAFINGHQARTGCPVNGYTLLAYESGLLIANAMQQIGSNQSLHTHLPEALTSAEINGPRGCLKLDPANREVDISHYYVHQVKEDAEGTYQNEMIEVLQPPPLLAEQFDLARKNLSKQGWMNPYLIA